MRAQNVTVLEDDVGIVGVYLVHPEVDDLDGANYGDTLFFATLSQYAFGDVLGTEQKIGEFGMALEAGKVSEVVESVPIPHVAA